MQGTTSSKKKKQAKLRRVMQTVKKHERRAGMHPAEAFAAMQLLHDPQVSGSAHASCTLSRPVNLASLLIGIPAATLWEFLFMTHGAYAAATVGMQTHCVPNDPA